MPVRKFSFLFFVCSIIAGIIGAVMGEWLLNTYYGVWPNLLLMGVYFAQLALLFGLFCLMAELIHPVINVRSWRLEYSGFSWKVLAPATLVMLFAAGLIFQFLYSLNFSTVKPPDDIVMVLDISDSMNKTDPKHESLKAAAKLIDHMKPSHRASVISFNNGATVTKSMFPISDKNESTDAREQIKGLKYDGGTDIASALKTAMKEMDDNHMQGRKPMVILFSDGYSELELDAVVKPYQDQEIIINTIGMSKIDSGGARLLKSLASRSGGSFHDIKRANELTNVFEKIYLENQDRLLMTERYGLFKDSLYLAVLRVVLITIIGGLFGLALGMIFDNRYLAKSYTVTGLISGILAGLVLEMGLQGSAILSGFPSRMIADILLTALTGLGTMIIPIREKFSGITGRQPTGADFSAKDPSAKRDRFSKGF
ncbi:von Willebrand factor type A [Neobacillus bataviensis LMG 21833]|uniref:von Willebrand factor type A n=1 Tax=Neobacillus bataviensis LMG 21833 TaxID=1117379 RepID=K6DT40_9BACI|nr:vWA domain-containing protein [Neobacillus bataviensis]EKN71494.1 von Willebrand factor type A [Neobacillus bataviensis LMG 21833]